MGGLSARRTSRGLSARKGREDVQLEPVTHRDLVRISVDSNPVDEVRAARENLGQRGVVGFQGTKNGAQRSWIDLDLAHTCGGTSRGEEAHGYGHAAQVSGYQDGSQIGEYAYVAVGFHLALR